MPADVMCRLLIVDDEPEILATLQQYFKGAGYAVDTAASVPEAAKKLSARYDVILSDIKLPGSSGLDLLRQARVRNPQAGLFLMTGFASLETVIAAKQQGASGYFKKPLNLAELDGRLRAFLGVAERPALNGIIMVIGEDLRARLGDRLARVEVVVCGPDEAAFRAALRRDYPRLVLADAADAATRPLLSSCPRAGRDAVCFVLIADEASTDAANELLFGMGASACIPANVTQDRLERAMLAALEDFEMQRLETENPPEALPPRCEHANPYRNGYYCLAPGACPHGVFQGGWIALDGKEFLKCLKRPFLVPAADEVGYLSIAGEPGPAKCLEYRNRLMTLIRRGKKQLILDALRLTHAHANLFDALADVVGELGKLHPNSTVTIINLSEALLDEFTRAMPNKGVRFYGPRMLDQATAFARWGTRFE